MSRRGENIRKRKDGRWEGRYTVTNQAGEKKRCSVYGKTYSEVKEKVLHAITAPKEEKICFLPNQTAITFEKAALEWLQQIEDIE
ncbi:MAG: hypothetical protein ACI4FV_08210 [Lachnospiraceae bacterium]